MLTSSSSFFFNDTAPTEISTLSLHDALPIYSANSLTSFSGLCLQPSPNSSPPCCSASGGDRKSTRLNSSHANISYAVFCLKKKNLAKGAKQDVHRRAIHVSAHQQGEKEAGSA